MPLIVLVSLFWLASCTTSHDLPKEKGRSRHARARVTPRAKKPATSSPAKTLSSSSKYEGLIQAPDYKNRPKTSSVTVPQVKRDFAVRKTNSKATKSIDVETPSVDELAKSLGLSSKSLRSQVYHLDGILRGDRNAENFCKGWKRHRNQEMCSFVSVLSQTGRGSYRSQYRPYVPISPRYFKHQQKLPFAQVTKSLGKRSSETVLSWAPMMLQVRGCPRNLSAAAVRKVENLLPSPKARKMIEELYLHASHCMKPSHKNYEYFHFRQALLRYSWGDKKKAQLSIRLAAKAQVHYERERVLYWAGLWEQNKSRKNAYWKELVEDFPLAYHSLEAWRHMGEDPYLIYTQRPDMRAERVVKRANSKRAQQGIYWLEALYVLGKREGAKRLAYKIMRRFKNAYTSSNIYYIANLKQENNNALATIGFLSNQISDDSKVLNEQTLRMLFPRPYFKHFESAQKQTKTNPYLLLAVTRQESAFNPRARSSANARGLMQILPTTASQMTGKRWNDLYSPHTNVRLGAQYMSGLIRRFGAAEKALAAYNAGPSRVETWNKRYQTNNLSLYMDLIPFRETRNYVSKILRNNYWYERLYQPKRTVASLGSRGLQRSSIVDRLVKSHRSSGVGSR